MIAIRKGTKEDISILQSSICNSLTSTTIRGIGTFPTKELFLKQTINDPDYKPDFFCIAESNNISVGMIMSVYRPWKENQSKCGYIKFIWVDPKYRRKGIATALLTTVENRLKYYDLKKMQFGASAPRYVYPGVPMEDTAQCAFFEKLGWKNISERISMHTQIIESNSYKNMLFQKIKNYPSVYLSIATNAEAEEINGFISTNFSSSWTMEVDELFSNSSKGFCSIIRTSYDNSLIGFAAVEATNPGWFGPMGVKTKFQKCGFGSLLVLHAFAHASEQKKTSLLLPWINDRQAFYNRILSPYTLHSYIKYEKIL